MGLLDKSELYIKQFSASDPIIRTVLERLYARKEKTLLDDIHIQMNMDVYNELIKKGFLSDIRIVNLFLRYPKNDIQVNKDRTYMEEIEFIIDNENRNNILRYIRFCFKTISLCSCSTFNHYPHHLWYGKLSCCIKCQIS